VETYRTCRRLTLGNMAMFAVLWVLFLVRAPSVSPTDFIATALFGILSALTIVAVPAVTRRSVRPLPIGLSEEEARKRSSDSLAFATGFAGFVALIVPFWAMIVASMTRNPWTYAVPFVVGEVMLYRYVLPRPETVAAIRQRLEADGATAYLDMPA
jgi:hypothetical protein